MRTEMFIKSYRADAAVARHRIVTAGAANGSAAQATDPAEPILGVVDSMGGVAGKVMDVVAGGNATVQYGETIAAGDPLTTDADGKAVVATAAGQAVLGYAVTGGVTGDLGTVDVQLGMFAEAPAPANVTWDPATKNAAITLSGGNLLASTNGSPIVGVAGTVTVTDKRAIEFIPTYNQTPDFVEAGLGVVPEGAWDPAGPDEIALNGFEYGTDGYLYPELAGAGAPVDLGRPVASGESAFIYLDVPSGKGWCDNASQATAVDREAGTNPDFTFAPGTPMVFGGCLYDHASDGVQTTSLGLNPNYASGTFPSLNG